MSGELAGSCLGAVAAGGVITAVRATPPMRRILLDDRLAPYLRSPGLPRGRMKQRESSGVIRLGHRLVRRLAARLDDVLGGSTSVRRRLDQSGNRLSHDQFRVEQVIWAAGGLAVGLGLALLSAASGSTAGPVAFLILAVVLAIAGGLLRDHRLTAAVRRREARIVAEFPTVAELLALAVGAGESPVGALQRVSRHARGALSEEITRAIAAVGAGSSLVLALETLANRSTVPALARFVDGFAVAVDRGTPLADVLRAQAADVREENRRVLLESSGRKEIAMLVPVVFFVLPVTVVFALFPGFATLHLAVP